MQETDLHTARMGMALKEAEKAGQIDEVPIGAVLVSEQGDVLATAHNETIRQADPTAHAEILALRRAATAIGNYRLPNTLLYVTIEPCMMCLGALIHARVATLVFGACDLKWGAAGSLYNLADDHRFNHQIEVIEGVCEVECRQRIQTFFRNKRESLQRNRLEN